MKRQLPCDVSGFSNHPQFRYRG